MSKLDIIMWIIICLLLICFILGCSSSNITVAKTNDYIGNVEYSEVLAEEKQTFIWTSNGSRMLIDGMFPYYGEDVIAYLTNSHYKLCIKYRDREYWFRVL